VLNPSTLQRFNDVTIFSFQSSTLNHPKFDQDHAHEHEDAPLRILLATPTRHAEALA
jgi:hypothetical protein